MRDLEERINADDRDDRDRARADRADELADIRRDEQRAADPRDRSDYETGDGRPDGYEGR